jgi:hypothetical protein
LRSIEAVRYPVKLTRARRFTAIAADSREDGPPAGSLGLLAYCKSQQVHFSPDTRPHRAVVCARTALRFLAARISAAQHGRATRSTIRLPLSSFCARLTQLVPLCAAHFIPRENRRARKGPQPALGAAGGPGLRAGRPGGRGGRGNHVAVHCQFSSYQGADIIKKMPVGALLSRGRGGERGQVSDLPSLHGCLAECPNQSQPETRTF